MSYVLWPYYHFHTNHPPLIVARGEKLKIVRNVANAAIEVKRSSKEIGSSLEANVEIYLGQEHLY